MEQIRIIARGNGYVVIYKPAGWLSEDAASEEGVPSALTRLLSESVYCVHRLDRTTAGLMAYATTKPCAAALSRAITDGTFRKTYRAYLTPSPDLPPEGELRDYLYFDRRADKAFVVSSARSGAKEAVLTYRLLPPCTLSDRSGAPVTAVPAEIHLLTGRTHQIRVQFASRHAPLLGDGKYGSRVKMDRPSLVCTALSFFGETYTLGEDD